MDRKTVPTAVAPGEDAVSYGRHSSRKVRDRGYPYTGRHHRENLWFRPQPTTPLTATIAAMAAARAAEPPEGGAAA